MIKEEGMKRLGDSLVMGATGNLMQPPTVWLDDSSDVSFEFLNGRLLSVGNRLLLSWTEGGDVKYSGSRVSPISWSVKRSLSGVSGMRRSLSLSSDGTSRAFFGYLRVPLRANRLTLSDTGEVHLSTLDLGQIISTVHEDPPALPTITGLMDAYPNPYQSDDDD